MLNDQDLEIEFTCPSSTRSFGTVPPATLQASKVSACFSVVSIARMKTIWSSGLLVGIVNAALRGSLPGMKHSMCAGMA